MSQYLPVLFAYLLFVLLPSSVMAKEDEQGLPVTVQALGDILQAAERSVTATLISLNDSTISAELAGRVTAVAVAAGDQVTKGQVLAKLDCRDYTFAHKQRLAGVDAAQARFALADSQLKRKQQLRKTAVISSEEVDAAQADFDIAKADLMSARVLFETARLAVSRCEITAPFAGQITRRHVQLGQQVVAATPVVQLLQNNAIEVTASLSAGQLQDQASGSQLRFVANGVAIPLQRRVVIGQMDGKTRTQEVRFVPQQNTNLPVGVDGRLVWQGRLPVLPSKWLVRREGGLGLMLEDNGVAKFHALPQAQEGQAVSIDLPATTRIIDQNRQRARDGAVLKILSN